MFTQNYTIFHKVSQMRKNNKSKVQLLEFAEALKSIAADVSANDKKILFLKMDAAKQPYHAT
ncbi:MAG: hypothetical protein IPJ31_13870 [Bacteroidetes bacterium]|nr:hypothetical protein [Bacteroidota bacterium]